ncbi:histone-lysine N-methyltransferase, H3 lysine-9 specific SUVH5-like [Cornus florida]|uniref:histone-lysine N-methyltransferase, H3 lysine-9 specific SUVH5-like n=1 Tax=Cornus florida TaxID=4283 RepID=UPI0028A16F0D|nr:histone-lysine N-methyltransferase, H3 lysine-9 specific SUVH5-like [Cornus florida]
MLIGLSPLSKTPGKRVLDHGGHESCGLPPNFKHMKVDPIRLFPRGCGAQAPAISERRTEGVTTVTEGVTTVTATTDAIRLFPRGCGAQAPAIRERRTEGVATVTATPNLKNQVEMTDVLEAMRVPVSCGKVEALESKMTLDNVGMKMPKGLARVSENGAQTRQTDVVGLETSSPPPLRAKMCLPPKIRKGVPVSREFPPHCGTINQVDNAEVKLPRASGEDGLINLLENVAQPKQIDALSSLKTSSPPPLRAKMYPPPKIRKGVPVSREFPPHCGTINHVDNAEVKMTRASGKDGLINLLENVAQPKQIDALSSLETLSPPLHAEKYPPPKIGEGVPVLHQFPPHCGKINHFKNVEMKLPKASEKDDLTKTLSPPHAVSNDFTLFDNYQSITSRNKVMKTLNLFKKIFEELSIEHQPNSKRRRKAVGQSEKKAAGQRHVEAAMVLKRQQKWINTSGRILGPFPGVEVGDQFHFRVELVIIGLHQQFVAGIDYIKKDEKIFATSIVASGRYGNHAESSDVLIYSGHGGNPLVENTKPEDQKLERGNLALKNSMDARTPVRVTIGQKQNLGESKINSTSKARIGKIYVYDGLYLVTKHWQEREQHGKLVYMFQLNRLPGQPKIPWQIVSKSSKVSKNFCVVSDISKEKEDIPINAVIANDDDKPPSFTYIKNMIYPELLNHSSPIGCDCIDGCSDLKSCSCTIKNGGEIPFNDDGAMVKQKPIVYECGPSCKCPPSCKNRVSQHGIRYELEVFKTNLRGWGVRSRNSISSGSFICEYVGELLRDREAEKRTGNDEYLFDIGLVDEDEEDEDEDEDEDDPGYTIDAAHSGNVGRFINHSCSPNLYAQNVLYDHDNKRMCHVMLFATRLIPPLQELTYDYNYKVDQVHDVNGNVKMKECHCGSRKCTGRMY